MLKIKDIIEKLTWSSFASVIYIFVQVLVFLYLSHHLSPAEFGIFSLVTSIILFGMNIIENGIPQSIIQTQNPKTEDYNAVLSLNFKTAFLYALILLPLAFVLIFLLEINNFIYPTLCLIPCLFVGAYNKVQLVGLQKNLKFKSIANIEFFSSSAYVLSILITIYFKMGFWILVISFAVKYLSAFLALHIFNYRYSDKLICRESSLTQKHWQFGRYIQGEKVITSILSYADVFIISTTLGVEILGIYDILKRIILRPIVLLYNGAEQLFYPLLVKSKTTKEAYTSSYRLLNKLSAYLFVNITAVVYVGAPLIIKILPEQYAEYSSTLKLLCIFSAVVVILNPIDIILYSFGKSKLFFKWILAYTLPLLILIFISSTYSLNILLTSLIVFYVLLFLVSYFVLIRKTFIPPKEYFSVLIYASITYTILVLILSY